jgi:hypothetical protein
MIKDPQSKDSSVGTVCKSLPISQDAEQRDEILCEGLSRVSSKCHLDPLYFKADVEE